LRIPFLWLNNTKFNVRFILSTFYIICYIECIVLFKIEIMVFYARFSKTRSEHRKARKTGRRMEAFRKCKCISSTNSCNVLHAIGIKVNKIYYSICMYAYVLGIVLKLYYFISVLYNEVHQRFPNSGSRPGTGPWKQDGGSPK